MTWTWVAGAIAALLPEARDEDQCAWHEHMQLYVVVFGRASSEIEEFWQAASFDTLKKGPVKSQECEELRVCRCAIRSKNSGTALLSSNLNDASRGHCDLLLLCIVGGPLDKVDEDPSICKSLRFEPVRCVSHDSQFEICSLHPEFSFMNWWWIDVILPPFIQMS